MSKVGTCHFKDKESALKYYAVYDYTVANIEEKLREGAICIGEPSLKPWQSLSLDKDGRYHVETVEPKFYPGQLPEALKSWVTNSNQLCGFVDVSTLYDLGAGRVVLSTTVL